MAVEGRTLNVGDLFRIGRYEPARVQRGYRWQHPHQRRLLLDLEHELRRAGVDPDPIEAVVVPPLAAEASPEEYVDDVLPQTRPVPAYHLDQAALHAAPGGSASYFLGHMVFGRTRATDLFDVYDGQQRLTTLAVLLGVIRDALPEGPDRVLARECLVMPDGEPRLRAPTSGGTLRRITRVDGGSRVPSHAQDTPADRELRNGAWMFAERLGTWSPQRVNALLHFLLNSVYVTVTFVDDRRLAETAYMTVNTRGLPLDVSEVIKGHVVRVVSDVSHLQGQEAADAWNRLRRSAGEHFEGLLRTVDFTLFRRARTHDFGPDLLTQFPDGEEGAKRARAWVLEDLPRYWNSYEAIATRPPRNETLTNQRLELHQLSFLPWHEWRASALWMLERFEREPLVLKLMQLKRACYVMQLIGWANQPDLRGLVLGKALDELDAGLSPFRPRPQGRAEEPGPLYFYPDKRDRARSALMAPLQGFDRYRPIVRLAETVLWRADGQDPPGSVGDGTVEHVLPRAYGAAWKPGFPDDDDRDHLMGMLGNLCMLPGPVNTGLGRDGYPSKRAAYLELEPTWRSAHDVAASADWNAEVVRQRTRRIAGLVAQHLGL